MAFHHVEPHPQAAQIGAIELWPLGQKGDAGARQDDLERLGDDLMRHLVPQTVMHPQPKGQIRQRGAVLGQEPFAGHEAVGVLHHPRIMQGLRCCQNDHGTGFDPPQRLGQALRIAGLFAQAELAGKKRRIKAGDLEQYVTQGQAGLRVVGGGFGPRGTTQRLMELVRLAAHLVEYLARRKRGGGHKAGDHPEQDHPHSVFVRLLPNRPAIALPRDLIHQPLQEPRLCGVRPFFGGQLGIGVDAGIQQIANALGPDHRLPTHRRRARGVGKDQRGTGRRKRGKVFRARGRDAKGLQTGLCRDAHKDIARHVDLPAAILQQGFGHAAHHRAHMGHRINRRPRIAQNRHLRGMGLCIIAQGKNRRACHLFHLGAKGHAEHIGPMQCRHDIGVARDKVIRPQPHHRRNPLHQAQPAMFHQPLRDPAPQLCDPTAVQRIKREMPRSQIRAMRPLLRLRLPDTSVVVCIFRHASDAFCKGPPGDHQPARRT